jgi:signal transduction histidine kinase
VAIPILLAAAAIAGYSLSSSALREVKQMTHKAMSMGEVGHLGERIPVPDPEDEIRELAETFNGLLNRLEKAFNSQERFISNASHQLKTPLTILKGELEQIKKRHSTEADLTEFFKSASAEIEHMIHLVEDLLLLARLEAGKDTLTLQPVALDEVLLSVVSRIQKLAKEKRVQIHTSFLPESPDREFMAEVKGDEELLSCLFENLIENAVKYTPENSSVDVQLRSSDHRVELAVSDEGPGIPAENRQKIFERFQRGYPSSFVPGSGLGLSIASEIAHLHGLEIDVGDNRTREHGTRIGVSFPKT